MSVAARHVTALFWRNALAASLAASVLALGLSRALARAGQELHWSEAIAELARALPWIAPFVAAAATCAELKRERSLVALLASGRSLRRVGLWLFLAGAPCAAFAVALDALASAPRLDELGAERMRDGSLLVRAADGRGARVGGVEERALEHGRIESGPEGERLRVEARWSAVELDAEPARLDDFGAVGTAIALDPAPRARVEPARLVCDALRPLVLLALAIGLWLRPFGRDFPARLCAGLALGLAYLVLELFLASAAAAGELPTNIGAFGAALAFGALGIARWWSVDRPVGRSVRVPRGSRTRSID